MLAKIAKKCAQMAGKLSRPLSALPMNAWVALLVLALVGGLAAAKICKRPSNLDALARESGNLSFMLENERPQINHAGTKLLFCHSSEKGVGVFICDIASGGKKMLFEEKEIHFGLGPHGVLAPFPWSPDDRWLVYAHQGPGAINEERALPEETELTICDGNTGKEAASLVAPFGRVVALEWLKPDAFVYVDGTEGHDFMLVQQGDKGAWTQTRLNTLKISGTNDNRFCALAGISSNTILWLQANCLWRMNVTTGHAEKLAQFPADKFFTSFDYCKKTRRLLLSCIESKSDSLWQIPLDQPDKLEAVASDIRSHDHGWNDARWVADGEGYAFIRPPGLQPSGLMIKTSSSAVQTLRFRKNFLQYFTVAPDQRHLFVVGDINNQPGSAIWEYDSAAKSSRCVVAGAEEPLKYLKHIPLRYLNVRLSAHERLNAAVFPPQNFDRRSSKKYPVVITSIRYVFEDPYLYQYPEAIANAGAYSVTIDHGWSPKSLGSWAYHIANLRDYMAQFPNVDRDRIFVLSNSAQAWGLASLFTNQPTAWRGAILLAPPEVNLPTPVQASADQHPFKLLITTESGMGNLSLLTKYQQDCAAGGMSVDYVVHPETPHAFIAKGSQRSRIQAMLHFVFDD